MGHDAEVSGGQGKRDLPSVGKMQDRDMGLGKKEACSTTGMEHEAGSRDMLLDVWGGACTSRMYLCWSFFIMVPFLEDQSMARETQIMTEQKEGS